MRGFKGCHGQFKGSLNKEKEFHAIGKRDILTPSLNVAIKEDLWAEMWKGIRAHKDLNLNLTPRGAERERERRTAENQWQQLPRMGLLKILGRDLEAKLWNGTTRLCQTLPPRDSLLRLWGITRVSQSHVLCQPQFRLPVSFFFDVTLHCCSACVIQPCLSNRILKFNHKRGGDNLKPQSNLSVP